MRLATPLLVGLSLVSACGGVGEPAEDAPDAAPSDKADDLDGPDAAPPYECEATDLMIVLDRTGSMTGRPDGSVPAPGGVAETKWYAAVTVIEQIVAAYESRIRFGLSMFPDDPDGANGDCAAIGAWLAYGNGQGGYPSNDAVCGVGETPVPAGEGTAAAIAATIDVETTGLCSTTPIGSGMVAAATSLAATKTEGRSQAVLLFTDGEDNCFGNDDVPWYQTDSLVAADNLHAAGVRTYVLGFDGSGENAVNPVQLNNLACAGGTAPSPETNCVDIGGGRLRAVPQPAQRLFLLAEDQAGLTATLGAVADEVACDQVE